MGRKKAVLCIDKILSLFEMAPVNRIVLNDALNSKFNDYEDAVIHKAALHFNIEYIVTRDTVGYKHSRIPVYTPAEFITLMAAIEKE